MINPAGISGEASSGEKKFHVQTEFAPRPKPRITTSVSLNGEVVQKVENLWQKLPQSQEDKDEIERFLRQQHQDVIKQIRKKGEKSAPSKDELPKIVTCEESEPEPTFLSMKEVASRIDGVTGAVLLSKDDHVVGRDVLYPKDQTMVDLARCSKDLASSLSTVSRVGNFAGGMVEDKNIRMVLIPIKDSFLAVSVNPDVDINQLVQKIKSVV